MTSLELSLETVKGLEVAYGVFPEKLPPFFTIFLPSCQL